MKIAWLFVSLFLAADPATPHWPGFLGAGATPVSPESIPVEWSPTQNLAWTRPLAGYGQSSPVIWGDHIYVTSIDGPEKETLLLSCVALKTGEVVWEHRARSTYPQKNSVYISRAAPTPVVDETGVYAYFESGDVIGCSHAGEARWTRSLTQDYGPPKNEFGLSASPVQTADRVMILIDDEGPSYLIALSKADGKTLWKSDRVSRKSWTSPVIVPIHGKPQVVVSSAGSVAGYDPDSGAQLWEYTDVGGNTGTTPTVVGDATFLVSATAGREGGNLEEAKKSNGLMTVSLENEKWVPRFSWTNPVPMPSWGSPVVVGEQAYWVNRQGVVYCLNAKTGELHYTERTKQSCWATPIGLGDHLYIFGKDGLTTVLATGPEFKVLAENSLWPADQAPTNNAPSAEGESEERRRSAALFSRPTVYGVALVNGSMIVRTGSQLFCIRQPQ